MREREIEKERERVGVIWAFLRVQPFFYFLKSFEWKKCGFSRAFNKKLFFCKKEDKARTFRKLFFWSTNKFWKKGPNIKTYLNNYSDRSMEV